MGVTPRTVAIFCGVILGALASWSLFVEGDGPWAEDFMIASWLPPLVLFPGAALAAGFDDTLKGFSDRGKVLWPAYAGLVAQGLLVSRWWLLNAAISGFGAMFLQTAAFAFCGAVLAVFPKTRPAASHIWFGLLLLLESWVVAAFT